MLLQYSAAPSLVLEHRTKRSGVARYLFSQITQPASDSVGEEWCGHSHVLERMDGWPDDTGRQCGQGKRSAVQPSLPWACGRRAFGEIKILPGIYVQFLACMHVRDGPRGWQWHESQRAAK